MTITRKVFHLMGCWGLLACLVFSSLASAAQNAGAYTFAKRYNFIGQITGTISPDPDGSGPLPYPATRNTYNDRGFLILVETGYLTAWRDKTTKPPIWGGLFEVSQRQAYPYTSLGGKLTKTPITRAATRQDL